MRNTIAYSRTTMHPPFELTLMKPLIYNEHLIHIIVVQVASSLTITLPLSTLTHTSNYVSYGGREGSLETTARALCTYREHLYLSACGQWKLYARLELKRARFIVAVGGGEWPVLATVVSLLFFSSSIHALLRFYTKCLLCVVFAVDNFDGGISFSFSLPFRTISCSGLLLYSHIALELLNGTVSPHAVISAYIIVA